MLTCFHAYDVRGDTRTQVTPLLAFLMGKGATEALSLRHVAVGYDARLSSPKLCQAFCSGVMAAGGEITSLGLCCTEETYWASMKGDVDGAVMITASHNPESDNGLKIVKRHAVPVSSASGLDVLQEYVEERSQSTRILSFPPGPAPASTSRESLIQWLLAYCPPAAGHRLKIIAECGNGCAGLLLQELKGRLPHDIILLNAEPDGRFPNGVPNPLLPEKRALAAKAVREAGADFGVAFDGDADRCFFYDNTGEFIEGYYVVGMLARALLLEHPNEKVIHDPRLYWSTQRIVRKYGGIPIKGVTGHAFMKERMRKENAIYGGEMSSHHYFRDFGYCDSGMIPFLFMSSLLAKTDDTLKSLLHEAIRDFPCSGEINRQVADPDAVLASIRQTYEPAALAVGEEDGLDMEFAEWRFSLRKSNTEPLLRLNVEARGDVGLVQEKCADILSRLGV